MSDRREGKNTRAQFKKKFAELISKTSLPNTLPQEDARKVFKELHDFVQPYIPAKLFRYRKCGIDEVISFEQGTISMCIADKFSDKYDSNVFYDYETLTDRFSSVFQIIMPIIINALKKDALAFPESPIREIILELISCGKTDDEIISILKTDFDSLLEQIKSSIEKQENWPRANKQTKIGCFTEKVDSKFMWDLYADGYKGFALEYDFKKWYHLGINLYPIIYSSEMLNATDMIDRICITDFVNTIQPEEPYKEFFGMIKSQLKQNCPIDLMYFVKIYLYKDKNEYSHEREWRMLKFEENETNQDFISIPDGGYLRAIYYGMHMEPRYKTHLRMIAKAKGIKEYDVVLNKNSRKYSLSIVPL